jgi:hypothetical protein
MISPMVQSAPLIIWHTIALTTQRATGLQGKLWTDPLSPLIYGQCLQILKTAISLASKLTLKL